MATITLTSSLARTAAASTAAMMLYPQDVRSAASSTSSSFERLLAGPDDGGADLLANAQLFSDTVTFRRGSGRGNVDRGLGGTGPSTANNDDLEVDPQEPRDGEERDPNQEGGPVEVVAWGLDERNKELEKRNAELETAQQRLAAN